MSPRDETIGRIAASIAPIIAEELRRAEPPLPPPPPPVSDAERDVIAAAEAVAAMAKELQGVKYTRGEIPKRVALERRALKLAALLEARSKAVKGERHGNR